MKYFVTFSAFIFIASFVMAQDESAFVTKGVLIILSTKNYAEAKRVAKQASKKLSAKLELRGLAPNKKTGLTYSEANCENEGGFPCYISRGRFDDGDYISIEYSSAFSGFTKGFYIVVAASGDTTITSPALKKAQKICPSAYVKQAAVYIGCMH